eukprot:scaffold33672_cov153-Skeletonema_dohrnii-CCMP3373.AAC.3
MHGWDTELQAAYPEAKRMRGESHYATRFTIIALREQGEKRKEERDQLPPPRPHPPPPPIFCTIISCNMA